MTKDRRTGSVGKVMPEPYMALKIEDNEILVKGESVFKEYYNSEEETKKEHYHERKNCTAYFK